MNKQMRLLFVCSQLMVAGLASAADCHDVTGTWDFDLRCVAIDPSTGPFSGPRSWTGEITYQDGCVFSGTISGFDWVGALHGDLNRKVSSDFATSKATGELSTKRGGLFREMSLTYTFAGDSGGPGGPQTACTGTGTRR